MSGCYHDTQDFKSDLNIEVAREGDILEVYQDLDEIDCDKNPGHRDFIPFKDLTLEHIPNDYKSTEVLNIKKMGKLVVRLVVDEKVNGRWVQKKGSGYVLKFNNEYIVRTNNHIVKTDNEVKHCTVEFHYNDKDRSSVFTSRGVKLVHTCPYRDVSLFTFHPVPDFLYQKDWKSDKNPSIVIMYTNNQIVTNISHCCYITPQLQFSSEFDLNNSMIEVMFIRWVNGSISYIKSVYFKFQPIPYNIQQLTSIEIHIDEDDGNSRVIPGDVVKCGDEFVVKISESIFQDEVKKCRLAWNGEFIGCGTRLFFQKFVSSNFHCGIDLEFILEQGIKNYWTFDCHPMPRYIEGMQHTERLYMCCIGHPHGGIKMVTFGRALGRSMERFDNQHRHISKAQPNPDCKCKEVSCCEYSCKTCPGSSGSVVHLLCAERPGVGRLSHFMGERLDGSLSDGEQIENKNIAWIPLYQNRFKHESKVS